MSAYSALKTPVDEMGHHRASSVAPELGDLDVWLESSPRVRVVLVRRKLALLVFGACIVIGGFTGVAYRGIPVKSFRCEPGDSAMSREMNGMVGLFNAISGFLTALVEVALGVYMQNFLAVFRIYLHNLLATEGRPSTLKAMSVAREATLFVVPVVFMLIVGQSLRSFQATLVSVGFESHMMASDLVREASIADVVKSDERLEPSEPNEYWYSPSARVVQMEPIILARAVNGTSFPFEMATNSVCSPPNPAAMTSVRDLDSASVVFGFPPHEWYSEMLDMNLTTNWYYWSNDASERGAVPPAFDWGFAASLFGAGIVQLDRLVAESNSTYLRCSELDRTLEQVDRKGDWSREKRWCIGANKTLHEIGKYKMSEERTANESRDLISSE